MENTIIERIEVLRKAQKMTAKELSEITKIPQSTYSTWKKNKSNPKLKDMPIIAKALGVSEDYLASGSGILNKTPGETFPESMLITKIPVLGRVQAGIPIEAVEEILDYEEISEEVACKGDYFALKVKGDSMEPKFSQGDVVIVKQQSDIESGDIAIVLINGCDATIKKVMKHDEGGISLIALNPTYPPRYYTHKEIKEMPITIIGKVVELRAKF